MSSKNCTQTITKSCSVGTSGINCTYTNSTKCDLNNRQPQVPSSNDFFKHNMGPQSSYPRFGGGPRW